MPGAHTASGQPPWRSSVHPGPSWRRSCLCSLLFSIPPPTSSSGPLLPPVFGSPASLQLPLLVLRPWALVSALRSGELRAQPCAARCGHGAWPALQPCPSALPLHSAAAQSGPTVPHVALPGTHAGSSGLSRSRHCPGVLSLPCSSHQTLLLSWLVLMPAQPRPPESLVTGRPPLPSTACPAPPRQPPSSPGSRFRPCARLVP